MQPGGHIYIFTETFMTREPLCSAIHDILKLFLFILPTGSTRGSSLRHFTKWEAREFPEVAASGDVNLPKPGRIWTGCLRFCGFDGTAGRKQKQQILETHNPQMKLIVMIFTSAPRTTCSTDDALLIMMASLKSGRSDGKRRKEHRQEVYTRLTTVRQENETKCACTSSFLCVNANQSQVFPQRL